MENLYKTLSLTTHFRSLLVCFLVIIVLFFAGSAAAQVSYKAEGDIRVSGSNKHLTSLAASPLLAKGEFILNNGVLDEISSLKFAAQTSNSLSQNDDIDHINFNITHTVVLPIMRKVFMVAILNNGTEHYRIDMTFDMAMNPDQSISLNGTKIIKTNSFYNFYQKPTFRLASSTDGYVELNINLLFKQVDKPVFAEIVTVKPIDRINPHYSTR